MLRMFPLQPPVHVDHPPVPTVGILIFCAHAYELGVLPGLMCWGSFFVVGLLFLYMMNFKLSSPDYTYNQLC